MGKIDVAPYEADIDQLCAKCVADIAKELKHCRDTIDKRINALSEKVPTVAIPKALTEDELNTLPDRINQLLKEGSATLKGIAQPRLLLKMDAAKRQLVSNGYGIGGVVANLDL